MTASAITPAILRALGSIQYDEADQHEHAMSARRLNRDKIADGRAPDPRLVNIELSCACRPCLDGMVDQARELGPWLAVAEPSPVERFVSECCELTPGAPSDVTPAAFCEAYLEWANENDENTAGVSAIGLGRELSARFGIRSTPIRSVRLYKGLALRKHPITADDECSANDKTRAQPVPRNRLRAQVAAQVARTAIAADSSSSKSENASDY